LLLTPAGVRLREAKSVLDPDRVRALLRRLTPEEREAGIRGLALLARGEVSRWKPVANEKPRVAGGFRRSGIWVCDL